MQTLITSSGIKHILSLSAAYFNSLPQSAASGSKQEQRIQSEVRPRFLQMVVLLLALLNDGKCPHQMLPLRYVILTKPR
jgi:hypothetical protein